MKWLFVLLPAAFAYFVTSFVVWDFNPGSWSVGARFFYALIASMLTILTIGGILEISE